jgi:DNA-binding LytR/AlgR family response regulator
LDGFKTEDKGGITMLLKIAICDDEQNDLQVIKQHLHHYEMAHGIDFDISAFTSSTALLNNYTNPGDYHVLFLDVEMPQKNGLETANYIRRKVGDNLVKIVFVSNYPEYMQDSFNVQAFHYFPKPFNQKNFLTLMNLILTDIEKNHQTKLLVREDESEELVYINDILLISTQNAQKKEIKITMTDKEVCVTGRIGEWENDLKENGFISSARGYLVNLRHIHYIKDTSLVLDNGMSVPLSRRNAKEVKKCFHNKLLCLNGNR